MKKALKFPEWINTGYVAGELFPESRTKNGAKYLLSQKLKGKVEWTDTELLKLASILVRLHEDLTQILTPNEQEKETNPAAR